MKGRNMILLLLSLVLALGTSVLAWSWLKGQSPEKAQSTVTMWVAKETIPSGTVIKEDMIVQKELPGKLPEGVLNTKEEILGKTTKETVLKAEGFPGERLFSEQEKLLDMRLPAGNRAYSISVTQYSAVADLLKAGDRIDVFVFLEEIEKNSVVIRPDIATLLLQDVEILGVRKELNPEDKPPEELADLYTLTLSVPVKDIEKLVFAGEKGVLKVALRPANATDSYSSYGVIWQELLLDKDLKIRDMQPVYDLEKNSEAITMARPNQPVVNAAKATTPSAVNNTTTPPQPTVVAPVTPKQPTPTAQEVKKPTYSLYTVQTGDTLMSISRQFFKGSASHYDDIMRMNGLSDPTIRPGQKLKIPLAGR